ncbi:MAG TPA: DCC1-like thiol-disulfide oxidoreductase family protein [Lacunisphaera sp.]
MSGESDPRPVLLYDGDCGLCNRLVLALLRSDSAGRLSFAPLQSAPARTYLRSQGLPLKDFDSLIFVPDWDQPVSGGYRLRTDGALAACKVVGGGWRVLSWLRLLPRWLRDFAYKLIARTRYALFGKYRPKPLPRPEWEKRFLAR